jgi:hypothetical protein
MKSRSRLTAFLLLATTGWAAPNLADVVNQAYQGLCDAKNYSWTVTEGSVGVAPKIRSSSPILSVHLPAAKGDPRTRGQTERTGYTVITVAPQYDVTVEAMMIRDFSGLAFALTPDGWKDRAEIGRLLQSVGMEQVKVDGKWVYKRECLMGALRAIALTRPDQELVRLIGDITVYRTEGDTIVGELDEKASSYIFPRFKNPAGPPSLVVFKIIEGELQEYKILVAIPPSAPSSLGMPEPAKYAAGNLVTIYNVGTTILAAPPGAMECFAR